MEETLQEKKKNSLSIRYTQLRELVGREVALFCLCAVVNIAYNPDIEFVDFDDYKEQIGRKRFKDGITKIKTEPIEGEKMMEVWRGIWGIGNESKPYTVDDYQRLDKTYEIYASRLKRAGGMDAVQEDTLRVCSKMRLEADKALARGGKDNISIASTLNKLIQDNLSSEQIRKKDAKPIETARIGGIVDALERKYGTSLEVTYDEAVEICSRWLVSHKYNMTMDAAEHVLLSIINCTRNNNDMPELNELPKALKFDETFKDQFDEYPSDAEQEAYEYLGLKRNDEPVGSYKNILGK